MPNVPADTAYRIGNPSQAQHLTPSQQQQQQHQYRINHDALPVIDQAIFRPQNVIVLPSQDDADDMALDHHHRRTQQQQPEHRVEVMKANNAHQAYMKIEAKGSKSLNHHGPGWGSVYFGVILPQCEGRNNVFYCPRQEDAKLVAIKRLSKAVVQQSLQQGRRENPYKEIRLMQQLGDNRHVLGMTEALEDEQYLYIIMPYCERESLVEWIPWKRGVQEHAARTIFRNVLENMIYLHQRGVCHRDLSPDNCMVLNDRVVFTDLAMSLVIPSDGSPVSGQGGYGKAAYIPPEVCLNYDFDATACDLWGAAVTLFNLVTGEIGWTEPMPGNILFRYLVLARGLHRNPANERTVEILMEEPDQSPLKSLAQKCLTLSPEVLDLLSGVLHILIYEIRRVIFNRTSSTETAAQQHPALLPGLPTAAFTMASNDFQKSVMSSLQRKSHENSEGKMGSPMSSDASSNGNKLERHKTPSWLLDEEDNQATVLGSEIMEEEQEGHDNISISGSQPVDLRSNSKTSATKAEQQRSSSLFGAVMQKIGSSISNTFSSPSRKRRRSSDQLLPSTPQATNGNVDDIDNEDANFGAAASMSSRLLTASPSGKTIMNIVNGFSSPFRFQSPKAAGGDKRKRKSRKQLGSSPSSKGQQQGGDAGQQQDEEHNEFSTPSPSSRKRRRRRLDMSSPEETESGSNAPQITRNPFLFDQDAYSNSSSRSTFFHRNNEASALSNMSDASASNWREAPITTFNEKNYKSNKCIRDDRCGGGGDQMEILDWSLPSSLKLELHAPPPVDCCNSLALFCGSKSTTMSDALTYWEFRSTRPYASSMAAREGTMDWSNAATATNNNKSIDLVKLGRRGSFGNTVASLSAAPSRGSILEVSKQASAIFPSTNAPAKKNKTMATKDLSQALVQSVRGPLAKFTRKRVMDDWEIHSEDLLLHSPETRWQQALKSLFQNYRNRIIAVDAMRDHSGTGTKCTLALLENYFYAIGKDHVVLFRTSRSKDGTLNPVVLVTRTSQRFRESLTNHGVDAVDLLETMDEQQARENSMAASNRNSFGRDEKESNPLLSPSVNADLEALRRAQAFGESAGADIQVKIKKQRQSSVQPTQHLFKPIRIVGWDNVSVFFEVYLNGFGRRVAPLPLMNETHSELPVLICASGLGPFDNSTMKRARILPVPPETSDSTPIDAQMQDQVSTLSFEVCGTILPCTMRKLLIAGRNFLLEDEANRSSPLTNVEAAPQPQDEAQKQDSSRYIVLHSMRSKNTNRKSKSFDRCKESIVLNQGVLENGDSEVAIFECPLGKSLSMAVWDISREEVAACKLEGAASIL
ncbi:MAG: hypothetical protein SGILL_003642 [Bacillariaceae sp.]